MTNSGLTESREHFIQGMSRISNFWGFPRAMGAIYGAIYLSPEPVRKVRPNEPKHLVHTVQFAARLRGVSFESLAQSSTANAMRFFGLDR